MRLEKGNFEKFTNMDEFMSGMIGKNVYLKRRGELTEKVDVLYAIDGFLEEMEENLVKKVTVFRRTGWRFFRGWCIMRFNRVNESLF